MTVPNTPSSHGSFLGFLNNVRRRGAEIDENGNSTRVVEKDAHGSYTVKMPVVDPDVQPIITAGSRWWAPEPEPEPQPEPAPVRPAVVEDHDRRGIDYTLAQAVALLQQGYHVTRVVAKTGWGLNHFRPLIDDTGYINL